MILFITSSFSLYFLKKCLLDLQLVLLKQRLEYHAPKENKAKRKLPYKLFKIVCSKVQHWLVGRLFDTNVVLRWRHSMNGWGTPWESRPDGVLKSWVCIEWAKGPGHTRPGNIGGTSSL